MTSLNVNFPCFPSEGVPSTLCTPPIQESVPRPQVSGCPSHNPHPSVY